MSTTEPQPYFRKRMPVEAFQFTGDNYKAIVDWLRSLNFVAYDNTAIDKDDEGPAIRIEALGKLRKDDWVVSFGRSANNNQGYIQIVNPENFERRFEK